MTKKVPMKDVKAGEFTKYFVHNRIFKHSPQTELIVNNGRKFTVKFFLDDWRILNVHKSVRTMYHIQTNGEVEGFNRTILATMCAYINDDPPNWDLSTSALTYTYNIQTHTFTSGCTFRSSTIQNTPLSLPTTEYKGQLCIKQE